MTEDMPFLGIDFGTSQSSMAWFNPRNGQAEIIRNAEGEEKTPSIVYYGDNEILVGKIALDLLEVDFERHRLISSVKRDLARPITYNLGVRLVQPVEVAAEIIRKLKRDAEEGHFHTGVNHVVVTHPAVFDQQEIDLLEQAAKLAGFSEVLLIPEPVAAAYAYAESKPDVGNCLLVYDFGGGTFDLAVLKRDEFDGTYSLAVEPRGIRCGGDDLDRALYAHCDAIAKETLGHSISSGDQCDVRFLRECQKRKENLSIRQACEFSSYLSGHVHFKHRIERSEFERLIHSKVDETIKMTRAMLDDVAARRLKPAEIVLIGGSSQVPLVQQLLKESLNLEPVKWQKRDFAVALGAACHARKEWLHRWHANPITTTCPKCQCRVISNLSGQIYCSQCQWDFEIAASGSVLSGIPIYCQCPKCNRQNLRRTPGEAACSACSWKFTIDASGQITAGVPIRTVCPHCEAHLTARKSGKAKCTDCKWVFSFDSTGAVVGGIPIQTTCPYCSRDKKVRNPGALTCDCGWQYEIDKDGKVIDGEPISASCNQCGTVDRHRRLGKVQCVSCNSVFHIAPDGRILEELRESILRNPLDDIRVLEYLTYRHPNHCGTKFYDLDRHIDPISLAIQAVKSGWNEGVVRGTIEGLCGGFTGGAALTLLSSLAVAFLGESTLLSIFMCGLFLIFVIGCSVFFVQAETNEDVKNKFTEVYNDIRKSSSEASKDIGCCVVIFSVALLSIAVFRDFFRDLFWYVLFGSLTGVFIGFFSAAVWGIATTALKGFKVGKEISNL